MQNRGNEAKKYLKIKDITFLSAANYARFACNLAQNLSLKGPKTAPFCTSGEALERPTGPVIPSAARNLQFFPFEKTMQMLRFTQHDTPQRLHGFEREGW